MAWRDPDGSAMTPVAILLVDDHPENLVALEAILKDTGHTLVLALSGAEALKAVLRQEFALILLDVAMPDLDGYETAELIRSRNLSRSTPIIFLSAHVRSETHIFRGYSVGAVDYLVKPFAPEVLLSKVSVFVELYTNQQAIKVAADALKRAYDELEHRVEERTRELARATLAKSDFLSSMSHELRSPLNAILGFAQLMQMDAATITPAQKASTDQILRAGWYLLELINDILDLAQIESGKLSLSLERVSLSEVMVECEAMIEPQRLRRGIHITFPLFNEPCFVDADRTRLKQVFINLLSNALKYNRAGGSVAVECTTTTPPARARIGFRDTGAGLPPEKLAHLFESFNRLGQEASAEEGTGIGLVVSKRLVELMGGVIGVESTVGVGSVFWIELNETAAPDVVGEQSGPMAAAQPQVRTGDRLRTLLYVEDNPANLSLIEELLGRCANMRLISASNGHLGIERARASQPEVILMDINLPGLSGLDALTILREDPVTEHIPIVALSANAMPRDIKKGLEAGFFRYLTKPIKVNEFMDTLSVALEYAEQGARPHS